MTFPFFNGFASLRPQFQMSDSLQSRNNDVRSNYTSISDPSKSYNPFSLFQGFMSGSLREEEQKIFPAISTFNYFKNISEVVFDKNRKIVAAYLENDPIWASASWSDMVGNMSQEVFQPDRIETSRVIDSYGSSMEELDKLSQEMKSSAIKSDFGIKKSDFDQLKSKLEKEHPTFYIKNIMKRFNPTILEYNTKFLTFLGYEPSSFSSNILRHGVPEIYPNMQKKYASMVKEIIGILIKGNHDGRPVEKQVKLLHSNLGVRNVIERIYLMRSFNQDGDLEIEIFSVYESLGEPIKIEEEVQNMTFIKAKEVDPSQEKEREEFLRKFYNIKKKDANDAARTCRIRYL